MEFKSEMDIRIAEKMLQFPLLGEEIEGKWNLRLAAEFHMTNDSYLFKTKPTKGRLPLYEGKMIWHFTHQLAEPKYWIDETAGREALFGIHKDMGQDLDYQNYRLVYRSVAASTNERSLISTIVPKDVFLGHSLNASKIFSSEGKRIINIKQLIFVSACLNSLVIDFGIRQRVTTNLTIFYLYQIPVPRLSSGEKYFDEIADRSAKLICTTPEFDDLAKEVGLGSHKNGVMIEKERVKLRAELDGMVAHLYGLTEEEFAYILTTFPIVPQPVKNAALEAYKALAPKSEQQEIEALIKAGESATVEFKSSARWDMRQNKLNKELEQVIVKTVAGFLNTEGGTLLIGVDDGGIIVGLQHDYQTLGKKAEP